MEYKQCLEIKKAYIEKGYKEKVAEYAPDSLPEEEIQMLFKKDILSDEINTIFNLKINGRKKMFDPVCGQRAKNAGVKFVLHAYGGPALLFMDEFLVVTQMERKYKKNRDGNTEEIYEQSALLPLVIPYSRISEINIWSENSRGISDAVTYEKKGNPVVGAVIGGALAGTTGAVIGAAATGRSKTVTLCRAGSYNNDVFKFDYVGTDAFVRGNELLYFSKNNNQSEYELQYNYTWTWSMNAVLTGEYDMFRNYTPDLVYKVYSTVISDICNRSSRYDRQAEIMKQLEDICDCSVQCSKYSDTKEFFEALCKESKIWNILQIADYLNIIKDTLQKRESEYLQTKEKLMSLQAELSRLNILQRRQKKALVEEIKEEEKLLNEYEGTCPDISETILEILGDCSCDVCQ